MYVSIHHVPTNPRWRNGGWSSQVPQARVRERANHLKSKVSYPVSYILGVVHNMDFDIPTLVYNEEEYGRTPANQKSIFIYEWLRNLEDDIPHVSKVTSTLTTTNFILYNEFSLFEDILQFQRLPNVSDVLCSFSPSPVVVSLFAFVFTHFLKDVWKIPSFFHRHTILC